MKHHYIIITAVVFSMIIESCKKNNEPATKDYAASIADKTWSGAMTYTADSIQYYSVHFNADKTLLWSQFAGDYTGNWGLNGKQLTMTFTGSNAVIKADISDDDQLTNITVDNTKAYVINSGKQLKDPLINLESSEWNGSLFFAVTQYSYQMLFLPGSKVQIKIQNIIYPLYNYTRSASGATIRFSGAGTIRYFGVMISATEMKGSVSSSSNPWRTTKK